MHTDLTRLRTGRVGAQFWAAYVPIEAAGPGAARVMFEQIDVLHRMCAFRDKGDTPGMGEFLGRSGHANNHSLWLVAQAVSEILPDGEREKQLMQGLLNHKEGLEEATRQAKLF